MRSIFRIALAAIAFGAVTASLAGSNPAPVQAQPYTGGELPQGVLSVNIAGQPVDSNSTPTITDPQPTISGQLSQSGGTVALTVTSAVQNFSATVGADGRFSARVPQPLEDGQHSVYLNGALVGTFNLVADDDDDDDDDGQVTTPTPQPPSTGGGLSLGDSSNGQAIIFAIVVGIGIAGSVLAVHARRGRA